MDAHRSKRRNQSRGETHTGKHPTCSDNRQRIGRGHTEELRLDVPTAQEHSRQTNRDSDPE
jgi:hypothetical protein